MLGLWAALAFGGPCDDAVACAVACRDGEAAACASVAEDLRAGRDELALGVARGVLYADACETDDLSCRRLAALRAATPGLSADAGGRALVERCGAGDLVACAVLAAHGPRVGLSRVSAAAGVLAGRCEPAAPEACAVAVWAWDVAGDPAREAAAASLGASLASRCHDGDLPACDRGAELASGRFSVRSSDLVALGVTDADLGGPVAAFHAVVSGLPFERDRVLRWTRRADGLRLEACRDGDPWSCMAVWDGVGAVRRNCPVTADECTAYAETAWADLCAAPWPFGCRMADVFEEDADLRCARGDAKACFAHARGVDLRSPPRSVEAYRTACRSGEGAGCFGAAARDPDGSADLLGVACRHGFRAACVPPPGSAARKREPLDVVAIGARCGRGDDVACREVADALGSRSFGYGFADSWSRVLLARACAADGRGCVGLAERYTNPIDGSFLPEARQVLEVGCEAEDLGACIRLHELRGEGSDKSAAKAASDAAAARCAAGDLPACALGLAIEALWLGSASSAAKRVAPYLRALEAGCKAGDGRSCDARGHAAATGRLVPGALPAELESIGARLPERLAARGGLTLQRPDAKAAVKWRRTGLMTRVAACGPEGVGSCREALEIDLSERCGDDPAACLKAHQEVWDGLCAAGEKAACDLAESLTTPDEHATACRERGRPEACFHVGRFALLQARSYALPLQTACDGDVGEACQLLGYTRPIGSRGSREVHELACSLGHRFGCEAGLAAPDQCVDGLDCAARCETGDATACLTHARHLETREATAGQLIAATYAERGCNTDDPASCRILAGLLHKGVVPGVGDRAAVERWDKACADGDLAACIDLWDAIPARGPKALASLARHATDGCPGKTESCVLAGYTLERHLGDPEGARRVRRKMLVGWDDRCSDHDGASCWSLARALMGRAARVRAPDGTDPDAAFSFADADAAWLLSEPDPKVALVATKRAGQSWGRACRRGDAAACVELGAAATTLTRGCPASDRQCGSMATAWWKRACAGGELLSCRVDVDERAVRTSCAAGDAAACVDLGRLLRATGKSGAEAFDRACAASDPRGCYASAMSASDPKDRARLLGEACSTGFEFACRLPTTGAADVARGGTTPASAAASAPSRR